MSAHEAASWLRKFNAHVQRMDLDDSETLSALDHAEKKGIQGGRVYDYIHATAAAKAKADVILTRNTDDFAGLSSARLEWVKIAWFSPATTAA